MTKHQKKPFSFKLPLSRFDVNLLPADARQIGSEAFKTAVTLHLAAQYAAKGQTAIVTVDEDEIDVLTLPAESNPLDFIMEMLKAGQLKEAVPYLESLAKTDPDNVQVLFNLGLAYSELRQFDEAIIRLKRAVQIDPTHAHAWTSIGVAYQRMGKPEQALEALQQAVEQDPEDGYGQRNLAGVLLNMGRNAEALVHLREARKALPHDPQTIFGLAAALDAVGGEQNRAEADELYLVVIQRWPASPAAEMSRKARTQRAHEAMRATVDGGLRPDVMMYIAGALDTFERVGPAKRQQITFEIAMKGQEGLDMNDTDKKYTLKTLPGEFSGMQLVAIMYTGFKQIDPSADAGINLQAEYDAAMAMRKP